MIVLYTDFGNNGPYVGQIKNVLVQRAPGVTLLDLLHTAPAFRPQLAAYLLAAYVTEFPEGSIFLCVVDPGVGTALREPVVMQADGRWFVGPNNGLFNVIRQRAVASGLWRITWQPMRLSASFHGRDLFAPVAAQLATGETPQWERMPEAQGAVAPWPEELYQVVYIDDFGNVMTGVRAASVTESTVFQIHGHCLRHARTFGEVPVGTAFWYGNANGLVECAVNQGSAAQALAIKVGDAIFVS